jgi:hypothetical protein
MIKALLFDETTRMTEAGTEQRNGIGGLMDGDGAGKGEGIGFYTTDEQRRCPAYWSLPLLAPVASFPFPFLFAALLLSVCIVVW